MKNYLYSFYESMYKTKIMSYYKFIYLLIIKYIYRDMFKIILVFIFSLLTTSKLVQVVSFFRHGARYHLNSYYDGNTTKDYWG